MGVAGHTATFQHKVLFYAGGVPLESLDHSQLTGDHGSESLPSFANSTYKQHEAINIQQLA